jgi:predicted N-acetyltransferase YhbS
MYILTAERPDDAAAIEILLDEAFGPDRQAKTSYRYRRDVPPEPGLSFVIRDAGSGRGRVVGTIRYWPATIGAANVSVLLLGPIAVASGLRLGGIGAMLMRCSLEAARAGGHRIVLLVGELAYYGRFGFVPAAPYGIAMPGEAIHRLLVRELVPGALAGTRGDMIAVRPPLPQAPDQFSVSKQAVLW